MDIGHLSTRDLNVQGFKLSIFTSEKTHAITLNQHQFQKITGECMVCSCSLIALPRGISLENCLLSVFMYVYVTD